MSGDGEGTCFKVWKKARTTVLVHKSPKLQMIDDPKVVATQYVVSAVVIVYFLVNIFGNFGYMKLETPFGSTNMWAGGYDFANDAGLCEPSRLEGYDYVWASPNWEYKNNKCRQFSQWEIERKLEDGGFYIQTYVHKDTVWKHENCADDATGCRYANKTTENYFVPGVENIQVSVEHGFTAVQRGKSKLMPKTTVWKKTKGKPDYTKDGATEDDAEYKVSEDKPFAMTLQEMLELAGVNSLDDPNYAAGGEAGVATYRMTGMVLELQIDYTNKITGQYDGNEYIARATVSKAPLGWAGLGGNSDYMAYTRPSPGQADGSYETRETYSHGVKIVVKATGEIGHFDFFFLMGVVTQLLVYWGLGVIAAEFVASSLLGEKSVDYVDDQRDYTHCVNHPESTRGERPAHWTNREGWDKDDKPKKDDPGAIARGLGAI